MPWNNFTRQDGSSASDAGIGASGPGPILQSVSPADPKRHLPNNLENRSGPAECPPEVAAFARKQAATVREYAVNPHNFWLPTWVREHIDQGGTPEGLLQKVIERVRQNPHEETLLEAQIIINEIGRSSEGTALIRQQLSKDVIRSIAKVGE